MKAPSRSRLPHQPLYCWPLLLVVSLLISSPQAVAQLRLESCELDGLETPARCGHLSVALAPSESTSPRLDLKVIELPARAAEVRPEPIFYLVGGPGQAATSGVGFFSDSLRGLQAHHRIVLLDLRGTGPGRPVDCGLTLAEKLDLLLGFTPSARLAECRANAPIDPSHLTTRNAVRDLEELRTGLGVERVHLLGISYGTRVAQVYAKLHPERVATLTLRGSTVLGDVALHRVAWGGERQIRRITERCAGSPSCSSKFPDFADQLVSLSHDLAAEPLEISVPSGGSIELTPRHLEGLLRQTVYSPRGSASVPWLVDRLHQGDPPSRIFGSIARQLEGLALEPMLSVFCAEDFPWVSASPKTDPTFTRVHHHFEPVCTQWNVAPDPEVLEIGPIAAPTLVLSGAEDPATPADVAEQSAAYLSKVRHVVTPGLGHYPTWTSCFAGLAAAHINGNTLDGLDTGCASEDLSLPFQVASPGERLRQAGLATATLLATLTGAVVYRRRQRRP